MQLLFPPLFQLFNDTPEVLEGYRVFFYESGTQTKLDTYSDPDGDTANANPMTLDSDGRFPAAVWGQNRDYKVVLALPVSEDAADPPSTIVKSQDPVRSNDLTTFMEMKVGSGNPNGHVAGTAGSAGVTPTGYWDFTNAIEYRCTTTGDEAGAIWTALNASAASPSVPAPQGYLTPVSATPDITSDQTAVTQLFYTPDRGNLVPIYNGATFTPTEIAELMLNLVSQHAANTIYDVFCFSNSGVVTLVTGPAWNSSTAGSSSRGTGASTTELARVKGLFTNAVDITGRNGSTTYSIGANLATYLGTILIDGSAGQLSFHRGFGQSRRWGAWNAYNRRRVALKVGDTTTSWTYQTNTVRASRNDATNCAYCLNGLASGQTEGAIFQLVNPNGGGATTVARVGFGVNVTNAFTGMVAETEQAFNLGGGGSYSSKLQLAAGGAFGPELGLSKITMCENAPGGGSGNAVTFYGSESNMMMRLSFEA